MSIRMAYGHTAVQHIAELPRLYPAREFASPLRSTIPHLLWWSNPGARLAQIFRDLGHPVPSTAELIFERQVRPTKGRGKASHTDLMVLSDAGAIGIEAKWTEGEYPKILDWLGSQPRLNRREVLSGWCELLGYAWNSGAINDIGDLAYQVVHRAASVCAESAPVRHLLYVVFEPDSVKRAYYASQLQRLSLIIPHDKLKVALLQVPMLKGADFPAFAQSSDRIAVLEEALVGKNEQELIQFGRHELTVVNG